MKRLSNFKRLSAYGLVTSASLLILVLSFQNCSGFKSTSLISNGVDSSQIKFFALSSNQKFELRLGESAARVDISVPAAPNHRYRGIEATPWVTKGNSFGYTITTDETSNCWSADSLVLKNSISVDCNAVNTSTVLTNVARGGADTAVTPWARNYNGVMSQHAVNDPSLGSIFLTIHHGENLNEINPALGAGTIKMQNSISDVGPENLSQCWSNYSGTSSSNPANCYWGFVSVGWMPNTDASGWGSIGEAKAVGPIAWPSAGYIDANGITVGRGVRHPSSIISNGYLYVYYLDSSLPPNRGIRVVRARVGSATNPQSWERLSGGAFKSGTLPDGFQIVNQEIDHHFYQMPSPASDFAFPPSTDPADRFSVAKLSNTNGFIGVETGHDASGSIVLSLRTSTDLINWSDRQIINVPGFTGAGGLGPCYSLLLSADGKSNTEVDPANFYVIGTLAGLSSIVRVPLHMVGYQADPPPSASTIGSCAITGGAGAALYTKDGVSFEDCQSQCSEQLTAHANATCTFSGNNFIVQAMCSVSGGAGAALVNQTSSMDDCSKSCLAAASTHPSLSCTFAGSIDLTPKDQCTLTGGVGSVIESEVKTRASCATDCVNSLPAHPNLTCLFGKTDFTPTDRCYITGGVGASLIDTIETRLQCANDCVNQSSPHPNLTCVFGSVDFTPVGSCSIVGGIGAQLESSNKTHLGCQLSCASLLTAHPNEVCSWNGARFN